MLAAVAGQADEELTAGAIWIGRTSHRKNASFMTAIVEFRFNFPSGTARAITIWASTLDDKARKNTVENQAVVKTALY